MKVELVSKLCPIDRFLYWCKERHQIYLKKKLGIKQPWTDDKVLQSYFFTNPYRENDKVTQWFRENIRGPWSELKDVMFATIAFRWFNWPATGKVLLDEGLLTAWNWKRAVAVLTKLKESGQQVFTGAYNISNSGSTKPKIIRVCQDYIQPVWDEVPTLLFASHHWDTMEEAHASLMTYPGLKGSGFMAYEVVCDWRYTYLLRDAFDKLTWSNPGPGAKRGLNRLLGRDLDAAISKGMWRAESTELLRYCDEHLTRMPRFETREVEHSLCEWDKYERARLGDGHMKRRYNGA